MFTLPKQGLLWRRAPATSIMCAVLHDLVGEAIAEWIVTRKGTREELFITNNVPLLPLLIRSYYVSKYVVLSLLSTFIKAIALTTYYYCNNSSTYPSFYCEPSSE